MSDYQIGKDIQELKQQIARIEKLLLDSVENDKDVNEGEESHNQEIISIELDEKINGYKYIIGAVSLNRRCWRELPFNKAYMNWAARAWTYLANDPKATSGPPYKCTWIKIRYNFGSRDCVETNSCNHTTGKLRHCHGAKLTGYFKAQHGVEWNASTSV